MTIAEISKKYLNQPNPQTGRGYWTPEEIAAAEKMDPAIVGEMVRFAQTFTKDKPVDPAAIQAAWDKAQAAKAAIGPAIKMNVVSDSTPTGQVPWGQVKAEFKRMLESLD